MEEILDKYMEPIFEFGPDFQQNEMLKHMPEIQLHLFAVFYFSTSLMRGGIPSYFLEHHADELHEQLLKGLELLDEKEKIKIVKECKEIMLNESEKFRVTYLENIHESKRKDLNGYDLYEKVEQFIINNQSKFKKLVNH